MATRKNYAVVWNNYALPRLGQRRLRDISPAVIVEFRSSLERGGIGPQTVRKTLTMLQSMFRTAVDWERVGSNPVKAVRKPSVSRQRAIQPLSPVKIESLRLWLIENASAQDAGLVSLMAYAGLRPQDALALRWRGIRERTLLIEEAVAYGEIKGQKTGRPPRTIRLLAPLRQDLAEWRLAAGVPDDEAFLLPGRGERPWQLHDWQNWRKRVFKPAVDAVRLDGVVPYDLRHSFGSLLIHEGRFSVVEIAAQLGHSPTMTLNTYGHVIAELADAEKVSAEELIRQAREEIRPISGPRAPADVSAETSENDKTPPQRGSDEWAIQDSNLGPLPYQRSALTD
jgi:integrase